MSNALAFGYMLTTSLISGACFAFAYLLITNHYAHGWGWLIFAGLCALPTFSFSREKKKRE